MALPLNWNLPRGNWLPTWLNWSNRMLPPTLKEWSAKPRHVVDDLEHLISVRVGPSVLSPQPLYPCPRPMLGMPHASPEASASRYGQLRGHVAHERQFAPERVVEGVVAESELVDDRRRQRAGVADHHLMHVVEQLGAVQFQRRRDFVFSAVAVAAHPGDVELCTKSTRCVYWSLLMTRFCCDT